MPWKKSTLLFASTILAIGLLLIVILNTATSKTENAAMTIELTSPAFAEGNSNVSAMAYRVLLRVARIVTFSNCMRWTRRFR